MATFKTSQGLRQISLFERDADIDSDPFLTLVKPFPLTVIAKNVRKDHAKIYIFNYQEQGNDVEEPEESSCGEYDHDH